MKRNTLLTLAAAAMLLAGCSTPNMTMELKEGKLSVTQEQHFGRPPRAWEFILVSDKSEMATRLNGGWKLADGAGMRSIHWTREDGEAIKSTLQMAGCAGTILVMREVSLPGSTTNAAAPPPFRPILITTFGTNTSSDGSSRIEVSEGSINFVNIDHLMPGFTESSAISPQGWRAQSGWFAFIESTSNMWAYDGDKTVYLSVFSPHAPGRSGSAGTFYDGSFFESPDGNNYSGATGFRCNFPCAVPTEVISHLPEGKQKAIQAHDGTP